MIKPSAVRGSFKTSKLSLSFVTYQHHFTTVVSITKMDLSVRVRGYAPDLSEFPNLNLFLSPVLYSRESRENRTRNKRSAQNPSGDSSVLFSLSSLASVSSDPVSSAYGTSTLTLWVPQFDSQSFEVSGLSSSLPSSFGRSRSSLQHSPFVIPNTLRVAPVFLTGNGRIMARFFSRRKLQIELSYPSYQSLENLAAQGLTYTVERGGARQHPHCKLFCEQKLRFLLSPYGRKVFYANHPEDLLFLPTVRAALGTEDLWLKLSESLGDLSQKDLAGFIRYDLPEEKHLDLRVLRELMADSQKITPFYC